MLNQTENHFSKIVALDLGDAWTGIAISDLSKLFAKPYITVAAQELHKKLTELFDAEPITTVVVGNPITMQGRSSAQTVLAQKMFAILKEQFPAIEWILWDERLSSQRAAKLQSEKGSRKSDDKLKSHAIAAAFILDSYLTFLNTPREH